MTIALIQGTFDPLLIEENVFERLNYHFSSILNQLFLLIQRSMLEWVCLSQEKLELYGMFTISQMNKHTSKGINCL